MKMLKSKFKLRLTAAVLCACLVISALFWSSPSALKAQNPPKTPDTKDPADGAANKVSTPAPAVEAGATNAPPAAEGVAAKTAKPAGDAAAKPGQPAATDEINLSFENAQINDVLQWLAEKTGKSIIKKQDVQGQISIMNAKKLKLRDAVNLIYRALALDGFSAIESATTIIVVREGQEPKMSPEVLPTTKDAIPEGRQKLVKIFPLKHIPPAELRDKVRLVLSDKGTIDVDERGNQIIVTDYNDNLRMMVDLVKQFDVASVSDVTLEIYSIKHADAEEVGNLVGLIVNAQPQPPGGGASSRPSPARPANGMPSFPPGMVMPGNDSPPGGGGAPAGGGGGAASSSSQQVRIWTDKTANRLIVSAPKSRLADVERFINILDTDKAEDVTVRVIALKHVSAEDLVRELGPLYQRMPRKSAKDGIDIGSNDRSNSLVVLSSEANFRATERLVASLDTEQAQETVMESFTLKNAEAEDVAKQLQDLNKDPDSGSRYPFFFFGADPKGSSKKKLTVVSDRRRNTVIVQCPPAQMESVRKLVEALDAPAGDESLAPSIFPLKYVSAVDIEDVLNELFLKKPTQRNISYENFGYSETRTGENNVGRLYGKVSIISEPYSNTIIISANSKENLAIVEEILKKLDQPSQAGETTVRVGLKFAKAPTVATSLNILFAKGGAPPLRQQNQPGQPNPALQANQANQAKTTSTINFDLEQETKEDGYYPWLGGTPETTRTADGRNVTRSVSDLVGRVRVVPDQRSNSLMISANAHFLTQVLKLVEELDAPTASVLIEARIVEVSSDFMDKLGVRWSPDGTQVFTASDYDNSILAHTGAQYNKGFGGMTTINTPPAAPATVVSALASLRSGVLSSSLSMDYLVQFLKENTEATVLAEPQINIEDNEMGKLFVGQQVPFIDNTVVSPSVGQLNQSQSFSYKDVGVVLEVTPHINNTGDVALKIHAESSSIVPGQTILGGAIIDTRNFKTDLTAKSGDTLVLGGIIQKQVSDTLRKTPFLGSIPGLGWAFKKRDKTVHEVELMVFLRPKIVRNREDARDLLEEVDKKAPLVKKWQEGVQPSTNDPKKKKKGFDE